MAKDTDSQAGAMRREDLEPEWQRAFAWVEKKLSAEIVSFERQPRWRPAFFVDAVRDGQPIDDGWLSALRDFTRAVVEKWGRIAEEEVKASLAAGFTKAQVLEVILAVALKLISNYTNQVADIPLDEAFQAYRWDGQKAAS